MAEMICRDVSLSFPLATSAIQEIRERLGRAAKRADHFRHGIPAIRNVNLHFYDGMRIGLVGQNGAGKTTLLKLLSGIFQPDSGSIEFDGKLTSLLTIRGGFDLHSTGRENIMLRSLLQGASRAEIIEKAPDIIQFADIGDFIDVPVSTYSNGMVTRLAIGIATAFQPNIVLMDEGILAGDEAFRERARARLDRFLSDSGIVVMAAHSRPMLRTLCSHVIWLEKGQVRMFGLTEDVLPAYSKAINVA